MKRILIVIHTNTYFSGLLPLAIELKRAGEFDPIFLFARDYPTLPAEVDVCQRENLKISVLERCEAWN